MKLKDFHETFRSDLQDREFVLGYLQECLEEGGIYLFISALKDVVTVYQSNHDSLDNKNKEKNTLDKFLKSQNPTLIEVDQVLNILDLKLQVQLLSPTSTVA